MRSTLIILIITIAMQLYAYSPEIISEKTTELRLSSIEYIEDKSKKLTIEDILKTNRWDIKHSDSINFGFTSSAYWFKFRLNNTSKEKLNYLLEITYPAIDYIKFYSSDNRGSYSFKEAGDHFPFNQREVKDGPGHFFRLIARPGNNVYIFRVESTSSINFLCKLWSEEAYQNRPFNPEIILYILLILILVINALYLIVKKYFTIIPYLFYLSSYIVFQASISGRAFQYLWPNSIWLNDHALTITMGGILLFGSIFYLLSVEEDRHSIIHIILILLLVSLPGLFIFAGSFFIGYSVMIKSATASALFAIMILLISSIIFSVRGSKSALLFFIGLFIFIIGISIYALKSFGLLPGVFITEWSIQICSVILFMIHSPLIKRAIIEDVPGA